MPDRVSKVLPSMPSMIIATTPMELISIRPNEREAIDAQNSQRAHGPPPPVWKRSRKQAVE